jgi:hypothetical protein
MIQHVWLLALQFACAPPEEEPVGVYSLPPYGGCSVEQVVDYAEGRPTETFRWTYDEAERLVEYAEIGFLDNQTYLLSITYDEDGCVTEEVVVDDDYTWTTTNVCTDGLPTSTTYAREGWEYTETYTYVLDGGKPVLTTAVDVYGNVSRTSQSWIGDNEVARDVWSNEEWSSHETWEIDDDGKLLVEVYAHPREEDYWAQVDYTYDEHGRMTDSLLREGELLDGYSLRQRRTWQDDLYEPKRIELDVGDDGELEATYDWTCEGPWPWACTVVMDEVHEGGLDGVPDEEWIYSWSCP